MAWYPDAVKKNIPPPSNDPPIKARLAILHVAATEATSLYGYFNGPSGGVESHFYVKYDGTVEQYRDTAYQADANMEANDFAISIESQGLADGKWTDAQLASIKKLLVWIHDTHSVPLVVPKTWDGSGVGYHTLFEDQWDQRHASCPGPNRIAQFKNIIVPWMTSGKETGLSAQDVQEIKDYVKALVVDGYTIGGVSKPGVIPILAETQRREAAQSAQIVALSAAVSALAEAKGADPAAISQSVTDAVKAALAGLKVTFPTG